MSGVLCFVYVLVLGSLVARMTQGFVTDPPPDVPTPPQDVPTPPQEVPGRPPLDLFDQLTFLVAPALALASWVVWMWKGPVPGLAALLLTALTVEPWLMARWVAIPRGWTRTAYVLTRFSTWVWQTDRAGGALFAGAWAAARRPVRDERAERWLAIPAPTLPLTGTTVAAHGLLAASRGDPEEARLFLRAAELFAQPVSTVRRVARGWLAAEAATRAAWKEVLATVAGSRDPDCALLAATASRALGKVQPIAWPPLPDGPWQAALEMHRRAVVTPRGLSGAARAWDVVLDDGDRAFREQVVDDLLAIVDQGGADVRDLGQTRIGDEVLHRLRERAFSRLSTSLNALRIRVETAADLPPLDEAREWLAVKQLYDDVLKLGGPGERREAFGEVYLPILLFAARLYNHRRQGFLFRAITTWLHGEAQSLGYEAQTRVLERNLEVSAGWR